MKKNTLVLSILLTLISLFFSMSIFNRVSYVVTGGYGLYLNSEKKDVRSMMVQRTLLGIDPKEFHFKFNDLLIKHNLFSYKFVYGESNEGEIGSNQFYTSTNDPYIARFMLLDGSIADFSDESNFYSTYSKEKKYRISNILEETNLEATSIINDPDNGGMFNLVNISGNFEENVNNFVEDLKSEYPDIICDLQDIYEEGVYRNYNPISIEILVYSKRLKILIPLIFTLLLCSSVFSLSKKISILKIEGYSSFKIYNKVFFMDLIKYLIALISIVLISSFIYYSNNRITYKYFSIIFLSQLIQLLFIQIFYSILLFLIIYALPIKTYAKGKNDLKEVFSIAFLTKAFITLSIFPLIVPAINDGLTYKHIRLRKEHALEKLENRYFFGSEISSNYFNDIGKDNFIDIKETLIEKNDLDDFSRGIYFEGQEIFFDKVLYFIDQKNILNQGISDINKFKKDEIYLFLHENFKYDLEFYKTIANSYLLYPVNVNVEYYNKKVYLEIPSNLVFRDEIEYQYPIFYIPTEKGLEGQIAASSFYFNGDISKAQKYIDDLFINHGYSPTFRVGSEKRKFILYYNFYAYEYLYSIITFAIIIVIYYLSNSFITDTDIELNKKRYFVYNIEGISPVSIKLYLHKIISPLILGGTLYYVFNFSSFNLKEFIITLLFFIVIESIMFIRFDYKYKKVGKR